MNNLLPIAEIFTSPQGEGVFTGQPQTFIRLAGCTVGKPYKVSADQKLAAGLSIYTEECTLYDGRRFPCDTDYRVKRRMTVEQILKEIPPNVENVCITGGEPLMHNLDTLITYLWDAEKMVHIETSGTINKFLTSRIWVTCSPKFSPYLDMMTRADEFKLLVDKDFDPHKPIICIYQDTVQNVTPLFLAAKKPVYLHPVNGEHTISKENLALCKKWQEEFPQFRIGLQLHKAMSSVLEEVIR